MMAKCVFCQKENQYTNYCNSECHIAHAEQIGGKKFLPNGLPVGCIRHDGNMYEMEHGDHKNYKFPVEIEWIGEGDADCLIDANGSVVAQDNSMFNHQYHALIYTDGFVALTIYECSFAIWSARDGYCLGSQYHKNKEWQLTKESIEKIRKHHEAK